MTDKKPALANRETLSKVYPPGVHWDIEIPDITIPQMLDQAAARFGDRIHTRFQPNLNLPGKTLSYNEIRSLVSRATKGLQEMGVAKGTKVGLFMPNTPYYQIMEFAAWRAGATVVHFNTTFSREELRDQIKDSGTSVMVTLDLADFHDKVLELRLDGTLKSMVRCDMADMLPPVTSQLFQVAARKTVTSLDGHSGELSSRANGKKGDFSVNFTELTGNDGHFKPVPLKPDDMAVIQYTGGTSGKPKGAILTHRNLVSNICQIEEFFCEGPDKPKDKRLVKIGQENILGVLPDWHTYGNMVGMLFATHIGATISVVADPRKIKEIVKTIKDHEITIAPLVPRQAQAMTENPDIDTRDLSKLDFVITGGAALAPNVLAAFKEATGVVPSQGFGMSELSPVAASNPFYGTIKPLSVGFAVPRTEIRIASMDNPDETVSLDETGEILVRGPQVMKGYHNRPAENAKTLRDGWLRTGDLGKLDSDYCLHIVGRQKRMIIVNGEKSMPDEVEAKINLHPAVAECVVIGLPDPRSGESAKAFIRLKPGMESVTTPEKMRAYLAGILKRHDVPKQIVFATAELPKTSLGKPDWNRIQNEERAKLAANSNTPKPN